MLFTFITPVDITPAIFGSYQDVTLPTPPAGTVGALLYGQNENPDYYLFFGARQKGSSQDLKANVCMKGYAWKVVKYDVNYKIQVYSQLYTGNFVRVYHMGWISDDAVLFDTAVDITPVTQNAWTDADISAYVGGNNPIAPLFTATGFSYYHNNVGLFGIRNDGSTDDRKKLSAYGAVSPVIIGCTNNIFETYRGTDFATSLYLTGYVKTGITIYVNGVDITPAVLHSWEKVSMGAGVKSCYVECIDGKNSARKYGSTAPPDENYITANNIGWCLVECNEDGDIEVWAWNPANVFAFGKTHRSGLYQNIGDIWKETTLKLQISNSWKDVTSLKVALGENIYLFDRKDEDLFDYKDEYLSSAKRLWKRVI